MLTSHQRITLLRAGITVRAPEPGFKYDRLLFEGADAAMWIEVRDDGLWDGYSGYGSPADVDKLRTTIRGIVELRYWTAPTC